MLGTIMSALSLDNQGLVTTCSHCGQRNRIPYEQLHHTIRCGKCHEDIPPPGSPVNVDGDAHFEALTKRSSLPVLVDFWAPWCGPCKMVAPEFEKVASAETGHLVVAKVNTEEQHALAARHGIQSIPTLILFAGGREVARTSGARPAAAIQAFVQEHLAHARA
jgi:thioredoxin 2